METVRLTVMSSPGLAVVLENVLVTEEAWQREISKRNERMHKKAAFLDITLLQRFFLHLALYNASEIIAPAATTAGAASVS